MSDAPAAELVRVSKHFGAVAAVDAACLAVRPGEFFSLLGPSGCGKTTTLRLLAGFETPDRDGGEIRLGGTVVNDRRPYERPLAMVFQNYALFPHLDVARNVSFGLEQRHRPRTEIRERVGRALELVRLDRATYGTRKPAELSGGQRQRVALARALVLEPATLLLDEPLGALDLKLRKAMQLELKALNRDLGTTFIYVTHDQEEALTMSDRIAVMSDGRVAQVGTPAEIYESPRTAFVAEFIGTSNILRGRIAGRSGAGWLVASESGPFVIAAPPASKWADGAEVAVAVRPEWLDLAHPGAAPAGENALPGEVRDVIYLGETLHVIIALDGGRSATVALRNEGQLGNPIGWKRGDAVLVVWQPEDCRVLES
ncbi:MAG: ABC transporter ATP-binding protein [Gemmatimonadales bacterium]|nr:ABC transporter ATP-binding protein [Gemmatimonadales bacterium]